MPIVESTVDDLPPLDERRLERLRALKDRDIDVSEMPALTREQLAMFVPARQLNRSTDRAVKIPAIGEAAIKLIDGDQARKTG
ncbi:MAG: hypothetical protein FWE09_08460 [Treponema sp.]|nr:hypothetical protein [Treponema sp.]